MPAVYHDHTSLEDGLSDLALLDMLTAPTPPVHLAKRAFQRRDSELDPLLIAAAFASGPHVTRNHYAHDFFPAVGDFRAEGAYDWSKWQPEDPRARQERKPRLKYVSRQAPRRQRLKEQGILLEEKENGHPREATDPLRCANNLPPAVPKASVSSPHVQDVAPIPSALAASAATASHTQSRPLLASSTPDLEVKCMARTRVPTPMARFSSISITITTTIRSILQSSSILQVPRKYPRFSPADSQQIEGRGIGLLSKIRAYNLQDLGHDTVTANLMLGHQADERGYAIAAAILRDLELGAEKGEGVRILTNNPDKMQALEKEGIRIVERVPMIPRSWQRRQHSHVAVHHVAIAGADAVEGEDKDMKGVTMIGAGEVYGEDLDKYLRTKVLRMGHLLPLFSKEGGL
ncbi:putative GTP cyclohydrolase-2 [Grifola frondosa]|uniref:Putative GTP cyclohydrolase-2 n=1 Tax=Grifola frondosa TaxID=5627 RepID=A0A1C7MGK7_GRIFR|nr:putative GTP cyclohydrolase-2 [Grifola frondosa]